MNAPTPDLSKLRLDRDASPATSQRRGPLPWLIGGLVLLMAGAAAWFFLSPRGPEVAVAVAESAGGGQASASGISANGYVVARTKASVSAKVPGRLRYLGVAEGSVVREGQIIASLENQDFAAARDAARAAVAKSEAELAQAQRDLTRAQALRDRQVISDTDLENVRTKEGVQEAQLKQDKAQAALAEANLENTLVRAPFSGTVLRKDAEVGEIVAPSTAGGGLTRTAIVTMADLTTLEVEVDVNEAYIARITNAQPARIILDAYPDTSFAGRVRQVVPTADRDKATVQVKVSILDHDPRILPEMGAKVVFEEKGGASSSSATVAERVLVPKGALVRDANGTRVWLVEEGRARSRTVEAGLERGDQVEIRSGLTGGESVILDPPAGLHDDARVRVRRSS
ncbi:MAG TPA: efflux RND transporter periplasmic adaptor subunit [Candidatus Eisenbacteria bacterium]|nr:efflux RND transporter periplasmic adaptor subunit [Candidatus Eisenbacteria bacterium]